MDRPPGGGEGSGRAQSPSTHSQSAADEDRPRQPAAASTTTTAGLAAAAAPPAAIMMSSEQAASALVWAADRSGALRRRQAAAALAAAAEAERAAWRAPITAPFGPALAGPSAEPALAAAALRAALGLQQQQRNNNDALEAALLHRLVEREVAERRRQLLLLLQQQQQQAQHLQQLVNLAALGALPPPPPSAAVHGGGLVVPPLAWQQQVLAQQGAAALAPLAPLLSLGVSAQGPTAGHHSRREGHPAPARGQGPDLSRSHQRGAVAEAPVGSAAASSGPLSPAADAERRGKRRPRSPSQRDPRQRRGQPKPPPGQEDGSAAGPPDADDDPDVDGAGPESAAPVEALSPLSPGLPAPMSRGADGRFLSAYQCLLRGQIEYFVATAGDAASTVQGRNVPIREGQVGIRCLHCARAAGSSAPSAAVAAAPADNSAAAAPSGRQRDAPAAGEAGEDSAPVGLDGVHVGGGARAAAEASAARWIRTGGAAAARGSAYYPLRLSSLYQAAQNMSNNHFVSRACRHAPASVVDRIEELKRSHRARSEGVAPGGEGRSDEGRCIKRGRGNKYWVESAESFGIVDAVDGAGLALRNAPDRGDAPPPARADFSP